MARQIFTKKDAIRHAAGRIAIAVPLTVAISWTIASIQLGTDPDAIVRVGYVTTSVIIIGAIVAALLTGGLAYYTARIMQELTLTRAELRQISRTDPLTGLLNRRGFDEAAGAELIKAKRLNATVAALMCDIDRFKSINDQFGHEFGDKVLIKLGEILRSFAAETEILIARHGGEEFAALLIGVNNEQATLYAETLRRLCSTEVLSETASSTVTVSIGLSLPRSAGDLATVMRLADQALYFAKNSGRDRVAHINASGELGMPNRRVLRLVGDSSRT
jgi:diguanylate cyclase (GGDEF)-like protein